MRMWMVNPRVLCNKHLVAEHNECHMFAGSIAKGINMDNYFTNNLFEPKALVHRHNILAIEMKRRDYKHETPLDNLDVLLTNIPSKYIDFKVDRKSALTDLVSRCEACTRNLKRIHANNIDVIDPYFKTGLHCPYCKTDIKDYKNKSDIMCINCGSIITIRILHQPILERGPNET